MIESALRSKQSSSGSSSSSSSSTASPPETCLALLSFFRHEYPLGGSVEARFIRFFPLLCERVFGPLLSLQQQKILTMQTGSFRSPNASGSGGNTSGASASSQSIPSGGGSYYSFSNEELDLLQSAWLNQKYRWAIPASSSTSKSSASGEGSRSRSPNSVSSVGRSGSLSSSSGQRGRSSGKVAGMNANSNAHANSLENDPLVQLLSPSPLVSSLLKDAHQYHHLQQQLQQQSIQVLLNTFFFHILESSYVIPSSPSTLSPRATASSSAVASHASSSSSSSSKPIKNLRISFPFLEFTKNMQHSYIHEIILHEQKRIQQQQHNQGLQQQQGQFQSQTVSSDYQENQKTSSDELVQKMHYPPLAQNDLIQTLSHSSTNHHNYGDTTTTTTHRDINTTTTMRNTTPRSTRMMTTSGAKSSILSPSSSPTFHITTRISDSSLSSLNLPPSQQQQHQQMSQQSYQQLSFGHTNHAHHIQNSVSYATMMATGNLSLFQNTKVSIDAWEYYMISFFQHAIYSGGKLKHKILNHNNGSLKTASSGGGGYNPPRSGNSTTSYGERMHGSLFKTYCEYYLPHIFDKELYHQLQEQYAMEDLETKEYLRIYHHRSEAWVRLMIEYFMNYDHVYTKTQDGFDHLPPTLKRDLMVQRGNGGNKDGQTMTSLGTLRYSYELATLLPILVLDGSSKHSTKGATRQATATQSYISPSKHVQRCIRFFVEYLIRDPAIRQMCYSKSNSGNQGNKSTSTHKAGTIEWPLSKAQTIAQTSFYNYVRTLLRHGPVHVKGSSFYSAVDLWLNWLEPWNVVQRECIVSLISLCFNEV